MTPDKQKTHATVIGRIDSGEGKPDIIRSEYDAEYSYMPDGFELQYDESEAHVTIICSEGMTIINRNGIPNSRMVFVPGETIDATYALAEGAFDIEVECTFLKLDRHEGHGALRIAYNLLSGGQLMSNNRLMISYKLC